MSAPSKTIVAMTKAEIDAFTERMADGDKNKMEFFGSRRWDAYRYVVPRVLVALGLFYDPTVAERVADKTGIDIATVQTVLDSAKEGA